MDETPSSVTRYNLDPFLFSGYNFTWQMVYKKWRNLKGTYLRIKDNSNKSGHARKEWYYYSLMEEAMGKKSSFVEDDEPPQPMQIHANTESFLQNGTVDINIEDVQSESQSGPLTEAADRPLPGPDNAEQGPPTDSVRPNSARLSAAATRRNREDRWLRSHLEECARISQERFSEIIHQQQQMAEQIARIADCNERLVKAIETKNETLITLTDLLRDGGNGRTSEL